MNEGVPEPSMDFLKDVKLHRRTGRRMRQQMDGWIATRTTGGRSIVLLTSNHRCIAGVSLALDD